MAPITAFEPMGPSQPATLRARLAHPACLVLAAALHIGLGAYFVSHSVTELGTQHASLDAVAVEIVEATPAIMAVQQQGSDGRPEAPYDATEATPEQPETVRAELPATEPPPVADDNAALLPSQQPLPRERDPTPETLSNDRQSEPHTAKAAPSRQATLQIVSIGEASQGVVNAYGSELMRVISKGRPKREDLARLRGGRPKGTVVIEFVVAPGGGLERIAVQKSSGDDRIDTLAMNTLQRLRFPAPSHEMTARQRTFTVPYVVR